MENIRSGAILARRNITVQMRQHALGYAWAILTPVIYAIFYIFVRNALHHQSPSSAPAVVNWDLVRTFAGISMIQAWFQLLQDTASLVRQNKTFFRGLNISPTPFLVAAISEAGANFFVRFLLIFVAILLLGLALPSDPLAWTTLLLVFLNLLISATAIGLLLAPWATLYLDIQKGLSALTLPLMLISPVFYAAVEDPDLTLYWINMINPVAPALATMNVALRGEAVLASSYCVPMLVQMLVFVAAIAMSLKTLRRAIQILLERLG